MPNPSNKMLKGEDKTDFLIWWLTRFPQKRIRLLRQYNKHMIKELIDNFYLSHQKSREQTKFYVSEAKNCPRQIFFKFKKAPKKELEARVFRIFEVGDSMHNNVFNILYQLGIDVKTEIRMPDQELLSGRADAILTINGEKYILDIKSINGMGFGYLSKPKEEAVCQLQLYLHFFNIKNGILLYVDKDKQNMKEFIVDYDKKLCEKLIKEFEELKEKIDKNIVPPTIKDYPKNWHCDYCPYKAICDLTEKETDWGKVEI